MGFFGGFWWLWLCFRSLSKLWALATSYGPILFRQGLSGHGAGSRHFLSNHPVASSLALCLCCTMGMLGVLLWVLARGPLVPQAHLGHVWGTLSAPGLNPQSCALEAHPLTSPCPLLAIHLQRGADRWGRRS